MKAFFINSPHDTEFREIPVPKVENPHDVLVKVKAVGICASDVHTFEGYNQLPPTIPGHEYAGVVTAVGSAVQSLKPGDRVVNRIMKYCGDCYACRKGEIGVCGNATYSGFQIPGGFEEYAVCDERQWIPYTMDVSFEQAAMVEPFTIGMQACSRGQVSAGDTVLIHGAGTIGCVNLVMAKRLGARVLISDLIPERLEMAKKLGADAVVNSKEENLGEKLKAFTGSEGVNVIIDCVGLPSLMHFNIDNASRFGRIVLVGHTKADFSAQWDLVTHKELSIVGSCNESFKTEQVIKIYPEILDKVNMMLTKVLPFEKAREGFELAASRDPSIIKVVVKISD
jgi:threonine dehydrogenase-like Zn-dependent dehydrogenase